MSASSWRRVLMVISAVYLLVQIANVILVGRSIGFGQLLELGDSTLFIQLSSKPWLSGELWGGGGIVFGYPVLLKLFGLGFGMLLLQTLGSAAAWLVLGWEVFRGSHRASVGVVSAAFLMVLSLAPEVSYLHQFIMTDSLGLSGFVVMVAIMLRLLRTGSQVACALVIPVALVWVEIRPTNIVFVLLLSLVAVVWAARSRRRDIAVLAAGGLLLCAGFAVFHSQQRGQVVTKWVVDVGLDDPEIRAFLVAQGMPINETVRSLGDGAGISGDYAGRMAADPSLREFNKWVEDESLDAYTKWLLRDPAAFTADASRSFAASLPEKPPDFIIVGQEFGKKITPTARDAVWPIGGSIGSLAWVRPHLLLGLIVGYTLVLATVVLRLRPKMWRDARWQTGWLMVYILPVHVGVSFFADTVEVVRHGLGAALQLRVALVLLIAWSVDALWVGRNVQPTVGGRGTSSSTRSSATEGLVATTVDSDLNSPALPDVDVSRSSSVPSSTRS